MFGLGPGELILIFVVALIIFGPSKLPEIGKSIGRTMNEFKKASSDFKRELDETTKVDVATKIDETTKDVDKS